MPISYDNTKLAVAKILGSGRRQRTRAFTELQSHYLFEDRFGRPGRGNDKGNVEGAVGYARRNFMVPVPRAEDYRALNAHLEELIVKVRRTDAPVVSVAVRVAVTSRGGRDYRGVPWMRCRCGS